MIRPSVLLRSLLAASLCAAVAQAVPASSAPRDRSVEVVPSRTPGAVDVVFDSSVLGRRATSTVWLPERKAPGRAPVAYYLHGVIAPGGSVAEELASLQLARRSSHLLLVAPDTGAQPWCPSCGWADSDDVEAERFLVEELRQVVADTFQASDRREDLGLFGVRSGASGALALGLRRNDVFGATAVLDPTLESAAEEGADAAPGAPEITLATTLQTPVQTGVSATWTELGLRHSLVPVAGQQAPQVVAQQLLPALERAFATGRTTPVRISAHSTRPRWSRWGYDVTAPGGGSVRLLGAALDGHTFALAGRGPITVRTPGRFAPDRTYRVSVALDPLSSDDVPAGQTVAPTRRMLQQVRADHDGRLLVQVDLDSGPTTGHGRHARVTVLQDEAADEGPLHAPAPRPVADLAAPFSTWNVDIDVQRASWANPQANPRILYLRFDSAVLGRRTGTQVYLPEPTSERQLAALYHLHGTGHGGQVENIRFEHAVADLPLVVVVPDFAASSDVGQWCTNCHWIDPHEPTDPTDRTVVYDDEGEQLFRALDGAPLRTPVRADSYLHQELIPLMEALFPLRTDRGGRLVSGNSMGALGARLQAMKHPDRFGFVAGLSGVWDLARDTSDPAATQWWGYLALQGYPPKARAEILYRDVNPLDLAPQLVSAGVSGVGSMGEVCVDDGPWCATGPTDGQIVNEAYGRHNTDAVVPELDALGLDHDYPSFRGVHYYGDGATFAAYHLPRLRAALLDPAPQPESFSYKSVATRFGVWGYDVQVDRPNREFLTLLAARRDGSDFTLGGSGTAKVRTPCSFRPHHVHDVTLSRGTTLTRRPVRADARGCLTVQVDLGPGRAFDERLDLLTAGLFAVEQTRIQVGS